MDQFTPPEVESREAGAVLGRRQSGMAFEEGAERIAVPADGSVRPADDPNGTHS
jgi:hypothetical protein